MTLQFTKQGSVTRISNLPSKTFAYILEKRDLHWAGGGGMVDWGGGLRPPIIQLKKALLQESI
jgi:hypothetical protein